MLWVVLHTMKPKNTWIEVDREGLKEVFPKKYVVRELIANMWDEMKNGAKNGTIKINKQNDGSYRLVAVDDSPKGFKDLSDSYTMFRYTDKRKDATVRGRFNSGDKYVLAHSRLANIKSTTGTYAFKPNGDKQYVADARCERGSELMFVIDFTDDEVNEIIRQIRYYKPPRGFELKFAYDQSSITLKYTAPIGKADAVLTTWIVTEDDTQRVVPRRKTSILIYEESPSYLYEMGIPVQEIEDKYSYDIQQKVPLDQNREMVKDSFLREVRGACVNTIANLLDEDDLSEQWVSDALESDQIEDETVDEIITKKYPNSMIKSTDPYANERAIEAGYNLISGREFSKKVRDRVIETGTMARTSTRFKTTFKNADRVARSDVNDDMRRVESFTKALGREFISQTIYVEFIDDRAIGNSASFSSILGTRTLTFNVSNLGKSWFKTSNVDTIIRLILHELAHEYSSDNDALHHLTKGYVDGIQKVFGDAIIKMRDAPEFFDLSNY